MEDQSQNPSLTLTLREYEKNTPDKGDYLCIRASVYVEGFAGQTDFWVTRSDFEDFVRQLDELDRTLSGEVRLRCGWGDDVYFSCIVRPFGRSGRLVASVQVAALGPADVMHRVSTEFVVEPNSLTQFRAGLRGVLEQRQAARARLTTLSSPAA